MMRLSLFYCVLIGLISAESAGFALEAFQPKDQVIRSHFTEPFTDPLVENHRFDPRRPSRIAEPYSPQMVVTQLNYPDQGPKNIRLNWLTRFSGPLAGLFLGNQGAFERAVLAYSQENYQEAGRFLSPLAFKPNRLQGPAKLWLSWVYFKLGNSAKSLELAQDLATQQTGVLKQEGYFLWLLQTLQVGDLNAAKPLVEQVNSEMDPQVQGFRMKYLILVAQVKLERWTDARKTLNQLEAPKIRYSPYYSKLKEMAGTIAYYENDFRRALAEFKRAKAADPRAFIQGENNRNIAWLLYFIGEYAQAIAQADQELSALRPSNREELLYLKIAALTHLERGAQIQELLVQLPVGSPYQTYGAFQTKVFLKGLSRWPQLKQSVSQVKLQDKNLQLYGLILDGNQQFKAGELQRAQQNYRQALKLAGNSDLRWLCLYNLTVVDLAMSQWDQATQHLAQLKQANPPSNQKWLSYHQLYLAFHLDDLPGFLVLFRETDFSELDQDIQWEVHRLKASLLIRHGQPEEAVQTILWGLDHGYGAQSLSFAVQTQYRRNQFEPLLQLLSQHRELQSPVLLSYEIRSLMALGKLQQAQAKLDITPLNSEGLLALQVDLWTQTEQYPKVIAKLTEQLSRKDLSPVQQTQYSQMLADAQFNQKAYPEARYLYQQVLEQTTDPHERSSLLYSMVLSRYLESGKPGFQRKTQLVLEDPELSAPVRLNLTLLLADFFIDSGQDDLSDQLLRDYETGHSYQRGKVRLKQVQGLARRKDWTGCADRSSQAPEGSTSFDIVDLALLGAQCELIEKQAKPSLSRLAKLPKETPYRSSEIALLRGQGLAQQQEHALSEAQFKRIKEADLSATQRQALHLTSANNLRKLGHLEQATQQLGDFRNYPPGDLANQALKLSAQIKQDNGQLKGAAKDYLRLSYTKGLPQAQKAAAQLKLVDLYLLLGRPQKAQKLVGKLQKSRNSLTPEQQKTLQKLSKKLAQDKETNAPSSSISIAPLSQCFT